MHNTLRIYSFLPQIFDVHCYFGGRIKTVSVNQAKEQFSSLIDAVEHSGKKIIIERNGRAVAEINPIPNKHRLDVDPTLKKIKISGDVTASTEIEWGN